MSKRRNDVNSMKELMSEFLEANKLTKGMKQISVREAWTKLMGSGIENYTTSVKLQGSTLIVQLSSSVLREELSYGKEKIINLMNEELQESLIKEIILA